MKPWPWPHDTELGRVRRIAIAYRTHLHTANPTVCDALDAAMRDYGQWWLVPPPATFEDTDAVTADLAAQLVGKTEPTIRRWASTRHPDKPGEMLLPRYGWLGPRRTYLVMHVHAAAEFYALRATQQAA